MELTPERIAEFRNSFNYNDRDDDGKIDCDEFIQMLNELGAGMNPEVARIGFGEIDVNKNGTIDFDEFINWWRGK